MQRSAQPGKNRPGSIAAALRQQGYPTKNALNPGIATISKATICIRTPHLTVPVQAVRLKKAVIDHALNHGCFAAHQFRALRYPRRETLVTQMNRNAAFSMPSKGMTICADVLNPMGFQFSGQIGRNNIRRSTCPSPCQRNWRQCEYSLVFAKSERDTLFCDRDF